MAVQRKRRRGTTAEHSTFAGAAGEMTIDTDKKAVVVHDGATLGGFPQATFADLAGRLATDGSNVGDRAAFVENTKIFEVFTTTGFTDWNHAVNTQAGFGNVLLAGNATNGPGGSLTYYPMTVWFNDGAGKTQYAFPHQGQGMIWQRFWNGSVWTEWRIVRGAHGLTLLSVTTFTVSGTWNRNPLATMVGLVGQAPGGGGGASAGAGSGSGAGSGAGGGGYQERLLLTTGLASSYAVTIGSPGTGGVVGVNSGAGTDGGDVYMGTLLVTLGGKGGPGSTTRATANQRSVGPAAAGGLATGSGGTSAGADIAIPGSPGQIGAVFGAGSTAFSGAGGNSQMGVGGKQATENNNGFPGLGYGGGGSGGAAADANNRTGGNGAPGIFIISEWG